MAKQPSYNALCVLHLLRTVVIGLAAGVPYADVLKDLDSRGLVERARSKECDVGDGLFIDRHTYYPCITEGALVSLFVRPIVWALDMGWERQKAIAVVRCLIECLIKESVDLVSACYAEVHTSMKGGTVTTLN